MPSQFEISKYAKISLPLKVIGMKCIPFRVFLGEFGVANKLVASELTICLKSKFDKSTRIVFCANEEDCEKVERILNEEDKSNRDMLMLLDRNDEHPFISSIVNQGDYFDKEIVMKNCEMDLNVARAWVVSNQECSGEVFLSIKIEDRVCGSKKRDRDEESGEDSKEMKQVSKKKASARGRKKKY